MPVPTDITAGTISISGNTVTGVGTSFLASDIRQGDLFIWIEGGEGQWSPIVQTVTSNTSLTLAEPWTGPTVSGARYRLRYQWDSSRVSAQSRQLIEMLDNGNVLALAGLTGPGVPVFDGPHSMTIRTVESFINGVAYNVQVDTLADRAAYDGQAAGFAVLVSDVGAPEEGRSAVYSKASNASGDWTDPAYITGPIGGTPDIAAGTTTTLPPGSDATFTVGPDGSGGYLLSAGIPAGRGFTNRGAYDSGEDYVVDDVVTFAGSTFIAIQAVPSGNPPSSAMPPVSNAYWAVLAARGVNGAGTVSSVAAGSGITVDPTDPTAPIVALANVPTATIKGRVAAGTGAPTDLTGTQVNTILPIFGTAKGLVPGATTGEISEGRILSASGSWVNYPTGRNYDSQISSIALELADLRGSRFGMQGSISDAFDDQTGINLTLSVNQSYDATNDLYSPVVVTSSNLATGGTATAQSVTAPAANAFDGNLATEWQATGAVPQWIRYQFTSPQNIQRVRTSFNFNGNKAYTLQYSDDGTTFSDAGTSGTFATSGAGFIDRDFPNVGSHLYWRLNFTTYVGSAVVTLGECEMRSITTNNMTLISSAVTAGSTPSVSGLSVQLDTSLLLTPGVDFDASVSRDGGTTFTTVPLSLTYSSGNLKVFENLEVNISGQPTGTSMVYRFRTLTNKNIAISGVVQSWR